MAERASLAKRDWLSVRDELWRVEDFLSKWSKGTDGQLSNDPVAIILAKEIDSYRQCFFASGYSQYSRQCVMHIFMQPRCDQHRS